MWLPSLSVLQAQGVPVRTGTSSTRSVRSAASLAAVVALGLLATGPGARAAEPTFDAGGTSYASGLGGLLDTRPGLLIISDVIHAELAYSTTTFGTTGASSARAASYYPGEGPLAAPALACAAAPVCGAVSPPDYPLIAQAEFPTKPEAKATASGDEQAVGPLTATPGVVTAKASSTGAVARVTASGAGLSGLTANDVYSSSSQQLQGGALVVTSEVVLSGVDLGGPLHVDQVRSTSVVRVFPDRVSTGSARTTVSGATVAGLPATISASGVSVQGQGDGGAAGAAAQTALDALKASGVKARVLPPATLLTKGKAAASTGGLVVSLERDVEGVNPPVPGLPSLNRTYVGTFNVAAAGVTGFASPTASFSTGVPPGTPAGTVAGGGGTATAPGATGGETAVPASGSDAAPASSSLPAAGPETAPGATPSAPGSDLPPAVASSALASDGAPLSLESGDLGRLALALLLYPLFVLASAVRRSPSRLPALVPRP